MAGRAIVKDSLQTPLIFKSFDVLLLPLSLPLLHCAIVGNPESAPWSAEVQRGIQSLLCPGKCSSEIIFMVSEESEGCHSKDTGLLILTDPQQTRQKANFHYPDMQQGGAQRRIQWYLDGQT